MVWRPDRTILISLPRRSDRRVAQGNLAQKLGFPINRVFALDGQQLEVPASWDASAGAYGNAASHKWALSGHHHIGSPKTILMLEDDADVPPDFQDRITAFMEDVPPWWEAIWLGGQHLREPNLVKPGVVQCRQTIRTHAYIVRGEAVQIAHDAAASANNHWALGLADTLAARGMTFAPDPWIVGNTMLPGDIEDADPLPDEDAHPPVQ